MNEIRISETIDLPCRADVAWAIVADYPRDPEWRTGVLTMTAEPPGALRVGTVTVEELRLGGRTYRNVGEVTAVEHGRSLSWRTTDGAHAWGARTVEPLPDGGCRATLELNVRPGNAVERVLRPMFHRMLRRNLRRDLAQLAELTGSEPVPAVARIAESVDL